MVEEMGAKNSSSAQAARQAAATNAGGAASPQIEMRTNVEDIVKTNASTAWMDAVEQDAEQVR